MANDIDKNSPHYKGEFGSIYEVNQKFPNGGVAGDYVAIDGWAHYWNADRGTWCVNAKRDSYWDELVTNIINHFKTIKGATYMGVATTGTVPDNTDTKMFYFATAGGRYTNFGNQDVAQGVNVLITEDGRTWKVQSLVSVAQEVGASTSMLMSQKAITDAINRKADKSYVETELDKKANKTDVDTALSKKADAATMTTELGKKFDKASLVQETGEAEDKVMSQKAVSDKLSDLGLPVKSMSVTGDGTNYKINNFKYPFVIGNTYYLHVVKNGLFGGMVYLQTDNTANSSSRVQEIKLPVALDCWVSFVVEKQCSYLSVVYIVPNGVTMEVSLHLNSTAYEAYKANSDLENYKNEVAEYKNTRFLCENFSLPIVKQNPGYNNSVEIIFPNNSAGIFYVDKFGEEHHIKHTEANKINGGHRYTLKQFETLFLDLKNNTFVISSDLTKNKEQYVIYAYTAYGVIQYGLITDSLATVSQISTRNNLSVYDNLMGDNIERTINILSDKSIKIVQKNVKDGRIFIDLNQAGYSISYNAKLDEGNFYNNGNFEVTLKNKEFLLLDARTKTIYKTAEYNTIYSNGDFYNIFLLAYNYYGILLGSYADFLNRRINEAKLSDIVEKVDNIENNKDAFEDKRKEIYNALLKASSTSDSFVFYTDTHIPSNRKGSLKIIQNILRETGINKVVYGGDSEAYYGDTSDLLSSAMYQYGKCYNDLRTYAQVLNVRGNHDFFTTNQDNSYNFYNQEQTFNIICKPMIGTCVFNDKDTNSCYYYYDDNKSKIRYIICDGTDELDNGPKYSFGTTQAQWIVEKAILQIPTGYNFIICIHEGIDSTLNSDSAAVYSELLKIVKACKSKSSQTSIAGKSYDFSSLSSDLLCLICGHQHCDTQTYCNGVPLISSACDAAYSDNTHNLLGFPSQTRTGNYEQCVDTFIIDKDKNKISSIRIGVGYNRHFNLEQKGVHKGTSISLISSLQGTITWVSYNASGSKYDSSTGWTKQNDIVSVSNGSIQGLKEGEAVVVAYNENYESEFWSISVQ